MIHLNLQLLARLHVVIIFAVRHTTIDILVAVLVCVVNMLLLMEMEAQLLDTLWGILYSWIKHLEILKLHHWIHLLYLGKSLFKTLYLQRKHLLLTWSVCIWLYPLYYICNYLWMTTVLDHLFHLSHLIWVLISSYILAAVKGRLIHASI